MFESAVDSAGQAVVHVNINGQICGSACSASRKQARLMAIENALHRCCPDLLAMVQRQSGSIPDMPTSSTTVKPVPQTLQAVGPGGSAAVADSGTVREVICMAEQGRLSSGLEALRLIQQRMQAALPEIEQSIQENGETQVTVRLGAAAYSACHPVEKRARQLATEAALQQVAPGAAAYFMWQRESDESMLVESIGARIDAGQLSSLGAVVAEFTSKVWRCRTETSERLNEHSGEYVVEVRCNDVLVGAGACPNRKRAKSLAMESTLLNCCPHLLQRLFAKADGVPVV